jgi:allantoinase
LLIAGGRVVDEHNVRRLDVLVEDGRVAALLEPGHAQAADAVLDAHGLHVLPGVVDAHVHFNQPGRTHWEGYPSGTRAAAAGGVTTVCDMPLNCQPPTLDRQALAFKREAIAAHAVVDYALWGGVTPASLDHLAELQAGGVVAVKAFLCDSGLDEYPPLDERSLDEAMRRCAALGLLLGLHAEDAAMTHALGEQARQAGHNGPLDWAASRPPEAEVAAVTRSLELARRSGARLHFVHISTAEAARCIAAARAAGQDVSSETCPHYLVLDEADLVRLGPLGKCAPPLRSRAIVDDLWRCVLDGTLDLIASDHSPCSPELKDTGAIWSAWGGISGVQTTLPLLLDEGVHRRGLSLPRLVELLCAAPARRLGLYPRKGTLQPGADADVALVDLDREWRLEAGELRTRWPLSPFVGRTFHGQVVATLVRGQRVFEAGRICVEPGYGRLLVRA